MRTLRLFWGSWIIVTGPLKILNWRSEMLRMSIPEKKDPLGCLNLRFKLAFVTTREFVDVDCCTASLSPTAFWMVKGQWKETCLRKGTSVYFAANSTVYQVHNRRHPFSDIYKKTLPISGQGQQPVSPKLLLCFLCLLTTNIAEMFSFHWQFSFPFVVLLFNVWTFQFLPDQLTGS